jgi:hypothetical protein
MQNWGGENTLKRIIDNESLGQYNNENGARAVNVSTEMLINTPGPVLMGRLTIRLITY